ncbi:MAG: helix-turn-helix domain-containing protein [Acidimicrobiales bacterium]
MTASLVRIAGDPPALDPRSLPTRLLSTDQAAQYLNVSVRTVKNLMSDGRIAYVKIGRATRIPVEDLEGYITRNRRKQHHGLRPS